MGDKILRALFIEDNEDDYELLVIHLRRNGYQVQPLNVFTSSDLQDALNSTDWDIILADYSIPGLALEDTLRLCGELRPDTGVIIVSGTIDEQRAVSALRSGACDFVTKDNLARLVPAIERELREKDIRKKERLARQESQLHLNQIHFQASLLDQARNAFLALDEQGKVIYVNHQAEILYGCTREQSIGLDFGAILSNSQPAEILRNWLNHGAQEGVWEGESSVQAKDGSSITCFFHLTGLRGEAGLSTGFLVGCEDISERNLLQAQLIHAQKMEAVGRLAGGVAHDFNNILTIITGNLDLAMMDIPQESPVQRRLEEAFQAVDRAVALTRQLLAFSRKETVEVKILDLGTVYSGMSKMLNRLIGEDVKLVTKFPPGLRKVKGDAGMMEQVLLNLSVNARDAMPSGGHLLIELENCTLDEDYTRRHPGVAPGEYVRLAVSDTGCGIPPEVMDKMFEPFFTTKESSRGTGLGLSMVHGIVERFGGHIAVYSELGRGTTFKVYFPRCCEEGLDPRASTQWEDAPGGSECILLAEDDDGVRRLAVSLLSRLGYRVVEARSGAEALEHCSRQGEHCPDLLLTDIVMPGMTGVALAEEMKKLHTKVKVLFMSGYTADIATLSGLLEKGVPFLRKPFSRADLAKKVREVLDGK